MQNPIPISQSLRKEKIQPCSSQCLGTKQVLNKDYPLFGELISYLHNCNSMKFFPEPGYNLSSLTLIISLLGPQKTRLILHLSFKHQKIAAIFHRRNLSPCSGLDKIVKFHC